MKIVCALDNIHHASPKYSNEIYALASFSASIPLLKRMRDWTILDLLAHVQVILLVYGPSGRSYPDRIQCDFLSLRHHSITSNYLGTKTFIYLFHSLSSRCAIISFALRLDRTPTRPDDYMGDEQFFRSAMPISMFSSPHTELDHWIIIFRIAHFIFARSIMLHINNSQGCLLSDNRNSPKKILVVMFNARSQHRHTSKESYRFGFLDVELLFKHKPPSFVSSLFQHGLPSDFQSSFSAVLNLESC